MHYREFIPKSPLHRHVECFWTLEGPASSTQPETILPDGCIELVLNFGAAFTQHGDGTRNVQPRNFLVGQMTGPIVISPTGPVQLIGIRFHPGGAVPFLRVPLHEVMDQVVELGSVSSELELGLLRVASEPNTLPKKVKAIERYLTTLLRHSKNDLRMTKIAARIVESRGLVSVDDLAGAAGISSRQLERLFLREVGLGPKLLGRIIRFQQVFRAVDRDSSEWAEIAIECGYYDQAHLIRDFNQFAQQTPAVLFSSQSALTESFTRKFRKSDFYNTAG